MNPNGRSGAETHVVPDQKQTDTRTQRAIRFSDSEWEEVKTEAAERGIPAAKFVRDSALGVARNTTATNPATIPSGIMALIERIYRSTYIVATFKRDEMIREGRGNELDKIINTARETQAKMLKDASCTSTEATEPPGRCSTLSRGTRRPKNAGRR